MAAPTVDHFNLINKVLLYSKSYVINTLSCDFCLFLIFGPKK